MAQPSATALSRYATARTPSEDIYNGSASRDFCNSFWGVGDAGPNVLFARMRGAAKTTDELRNFWSERSMIEEEYASRLSKLAKAPIGADEIGDLRVSFDTLRLETEKQAQSHLKLAHQIRDELESVTGQFHLKQVNHRRTFQAALEKKFKAKQTQEAYVAKAREKYDADCLRINSYSQQASFMQGKDLDRIQMKLQRAKQTVQANERDLANFTKTLLDLLPEWEADWKEFCDTCQDLEEERIDFMKDTMWAYANGVSTICVEDDVSCEGIRTTLDQLEAVHDVRSFVEEYGTGNSIPEPPEFDPENGPQKTGPIIRTADFARVSRRPPLIQPEGELSDPQSRHQHHHEAPTVADTSPPQQHTNGDIRQPSPHSQISNEASAAQNGNTRARVRDSRSPPRTEPPSNPPPPLPESQPPSRQASASASTPAAAPANGLTRRRTQRQSQPLPVPGRQGGQTSRGGQNTERAPTPPPLPNQGNNLNNHILFYVKALYDYEATTEEEFDFQTNDIIAVTATPDDGWWSGELLDENRREEGRNIFPSNFVCLF
ncbi:hypothetical protein BDQ12DRAFT_695292 [Crucibulum laeve]|uniref:SH3 domain-containing protein n=1 Tax=Crucibulum laeve TaxID=68775 RepID=A0A5C3MJA6_9AGAR|nr:hypothetical protein BDQ12DRAFT_695292 [Crucibulum laeve]